MQNITVCMRKKTEAPSPEGRVVALLLRTPARLLLGLLDCRDTGRREPLNDQALSPGG